MSDETLLLNYGQDVDYRLSGGDGKAMTTEWNRLAAGSKLQVILPRLPCTLEFRLGEQTASEWIDKPVAAIEVSQVLQVRSRAA